MKLLIKFPTRNRPTVFWNSFNLYRNLLSGKHQVQFVITLNKDDASMNNPFMRKQLELENVSVHYGNSRCKVEAINADMEGREFDVLLLASDDMLPKTRNYDNTIANEMENAFPDTFGVLHFHDGRVGRILNTLTIMGKKMYDRYGYIYHPDYISLWCDNEFHDTSMATGKVKWINNTIIEHKWTEVTGKDDLHIKNENFYRIDEKVYNFRKSLGFPKESVISQLCAEDKAERQRLFPQ